jgi:hypothetical protein
MATEREQRGPSEAERANRRPVGDDEAAALDACYALIEQIARRLDAEAAEGASSGDELESRRRGRRW